MTLDQAFGVCCNMQLAPTVECVKYKREFVALRLRVLFNSTYWHLKFQNVFVSLQMLLCTGLFNLLSTFVRRKPADETL